MPEVLVVFGSASDANVFEPLLSEFQSSKTSFDFRVLSAHRTPKELEKAVVGSDAKIIVAGAGLSAALPGVIAAHTIRPVIAVPCGSTFHGLDAFLASVQTPSGIPVLSVGVAKSSEAAKHCVNALKGFSSVVLVERTGTESSAAPAKCEEKLNELGVKFEEETDSNYSDPKKIFIDFVQLEKAAALPETNATVIVCAVKGSSSASDSMEFLKAAGKHLWVGLNRGENAAIAAVELLNLNGKFDSVLDAERKNLREKMLESDKEIKNKLAK